MIYPILALAAIICVPISLFVGLWLGNSLVMVTLPFIPLMLGVYFGAKAEEAATKL